MLNEKRISIHNLIRGCIIIAALAIFLWVCGSDMFKSEVSSSSGAENNRNVEGLAPDNNVTQVFVPKHNYIEKLGVLMNFPAEYSKDAEVTVQLYEAGTGAIVSTASKNYSDVISGTYDYFVLDADVVAGDTYCFIFTVSGQNAEGLKLVYRDMQIAGPTENIGLEYNGSAIYNGSLACDIVYQIPLRSAQMFAYAAFITFVGSILISLVKKYLPNKIGDRTIGLPMLLKCIATFTISISALTLLYLSLIKKLFGTMTLDLIFYGFGIVAIAIYLLFAIWKTNIRFPDINKETRIDYALALIRTFCVAFHIVMYVYYFNSGVNYGHYLGYSWMLLSFGVLTLTLFSLKEVISLPSIIYTIGYSVLTIGWMITHDYGGENTKIYWVAIAFGLVWGIVLIRTVINLFRKRLRRLSIPYSVILFGFLVLQIAFRNDRVVPWFLFISFLLFYVQKALETDWNKLAGSICWGTLVSFWFLVIKALMNRPYHRSIYSRYPGVFTAVGIWGVYLTLVLAVSVGKLVVEYKKDSKFSNIWFYCLTVAACASYIIFSVSRTAMLGASVLIGVMTVVLGMSLYRKYFKKLLMLMVTTLGIVVVLFPSFYSLTRIVPAIVRDPYIGRYELIEDSILATDPSDSEKYMNVEGMLKICLKRVMSTITVQGMTRTKVDENENILEHTEGINTQEKFANLVENDRTGGRISLWLEHLSKLNLSGHQGQSHPHNIFVQVAYDSGVLTGICFLILGVMSFVRSIIYFVNHKEKHIFTILSLVVIIAFGTAGMTEWAYHPSIPTTFLLFLVQAPLLAPLKKKEKEPNDAEVGIKF